MNNTTSIDTNDLGSFFSSRNHGCCDQVSIRDFFPILQAINAEGRQNDQRFALVAKSICDAETRILGRIDCFEKEQLLRKISELEVKLACKCKPIEE